jgi:hypothetical protein
MGGQYFLVADRLARLWRGLGRGCDPASGCAEVLQTRGLSRTEVTVIASTSL